MSNKEIPVIPVKTREQVSSEYSTKYNPVSVRMLNAQIEKYELPIKPNTSFFPKQQKIIYEALGYPPSVDRTLYENV